MSKKILNFGLIGLGGISRFYLPAIAQHSQAQLVGVCDINHQALDSVSPNIKYRETKAALFVAHADIDVVIIATPNHTHFPLIKQALQAGKHVICEKPVVTEPHLFDELATLAKSKQLVLQGVYHRRYNEAFLRLQRELNNETITYITFRYLEDIREHSAGEEWYQDASLAGGGCVMDNGVNCIDNFLQLVHDLRPVSVHFGHGLQGKKTPETNAVIEFTFNKGKAILELDWLFPGEEKQMTVYTASGKVLYCDFLGGWSNFKGSLWHEYERAIAEIVQKIQMKNFERDQVTDLNLMLVNQIYAMTK